VPPEADAGKKGQAIRNFNRANELRLFGGNLRRASYRKRHVQHSPLARTTDCCGDHVRSFSTAFQSNHSSEGNGI